MFFNALEVTCAPFLSPSDAKIPDGIIRAKESAIASKPGYEVTFASYIPKSSILEKSANAASGLLKYSLRSSKLISLVTGNISKIGAILASPVLKESKVNERSDGTLFPALIDKVCARFSGP